MLRAAGELRRTPLERADQQVSWDRPDQAFFAAGACHVLAYACRLRHPDRGLGIAALRHVGETQVWHTYAVWGTWAFDASGWHPEQDLVRVNEQFEGRRLERIEITTDLATFCREHRHRPPEDFAGPVWPRALAHVARFTPPWDLGTEGPAV